MDPTKLPSKEAKSLSFLAYSLVCLISASLAGDVSTKIVFWIFALSAFLLAAVKFLKDSVKLPLWPCKNRCDGNAEFACVRDKGFYFGASASILAILVIKLFQLGFPLSKASSLFAAVLCTLTTIIHGTLRRSCGFLSSGDRLDKLLTFLTGFATGLGLFFAAIYFI